MTKTDKVNAWVKAGWLLMAVGTVLSLGIANGFGNADTCKGFNKGMECLIWSVVCFGPFSVLAAVFLWVGVDKTTLDSQHRRGAVLSAAVCTVPALIFVGLLMLWLPGL